MRSNIVRTLTATAIIAAAGFGGATLASADTAVQPGTVVQPGTEKGAYCTVVDEDGILTQLHTPSQCLQARITARLEERAAQQAADREERRADRD